MLKVPQVISPQLSCPETIDLPVPEFGFSRITAAFRVSPNCHRPEHSNPFLHATARFLFEQEDEYIPLYDLQLPKVPGERPERRKQTWLVEQRHRPPIPPQRRRACRDNLRLCFCANGY